MCRCTCVGSREQFVKWRQSQLVTGLSVGCSAFLLARCKLAHGSHGLNVLAFTLLRGANTRLGRTRNKVEAWYPRDACLHRSILVQLVTIGSLLGESLSWDWTGLVDLGVGCLHKVCSRCGGLQSVVSVCSPLPTLPFPLYPPEKASALHPALLLTHCASWQIHNLTFLGLS